MKRIDNEMFLPQSLILSIDGLVSLLVTFSNTVKTCGHKRIFSSVV